MSRLKTLARTERGIPPLRGGHALCQGCGIPLVVRTVLDSIGGPAVVVNATGCLEVATTRYPTTAWNVPWLHVAFENTAPDAAGIDTVNRSSRSFTYLIGERGTPTPELQDERRRTAG